MWFFFCFEASNIHWMFVQQIVSALFLLLLSRTESHFSCSFLEGIHRTVLQMEILDKVPLLVIPASAERTLSQFNRLWQSERQLELS
jgi:hypothetical protein